jgi:FkbM family methyltransferase
MISTLTLRKWIYHLPPPVINLARRVGQALPWVPVVHTDATWRKKCASALAVVGGVVGPVQQGQCRIAWPAKKKGTASLQASLRVNPSSDLDVFCQVWTDEYYRAVAKYMRRWVAPDARLRIIDAGANVGFTTLYLKAQFPHARIISLEPEDSNFAQLARNVAHNNLTDVTPKKAGLWKSRAYLEVGRDLFDKREWSFYVKEAAGPTALLGYDVQTLLQEAHWDGVDLLKMDIEGAERYLFADDVSAMETLRSVRFLAIEIHDGEGLRERIYGYLRQLGFEFFDSGELTIGHNTNLVPRP